MKQLDRLVVHELAGPLINSILMFLMMLFATASLFNLTELLVKGIPFPTVARIAIYNIPMLVTKTLPMSVLLACLLAFGRLSSDSENIALHAGGISFFRAMRPVAFVGAIMSVVAFVWDETIVPPATRQFVRLRAEVLGGLATAGQELFYTVKSSDGNHVARIINVYGGYDQKSNTLRKVMIIEMSHDRASVGEPAFCIYAQRARPNLKDVSGFDWTFEDGRVNDLRDNPERKTIVDVHFKEITTKSLQESTGTPVTMGRTLQGIFRAQKRDNNTMTFHELRDKINEERLAGSLDTDGDEVDLWGKISTPIASLIFALVGAPLGVRPQRGSKAIGFGIAIGIIFAYWFLYNWLYQIGKNGGLSPMIASFAPNMIGIVAGIFLVSRTRQ